MIISYTTLFHRMGDSGAQYLGKVKLSEEQSDTRVSVCVFGEM